MTKQFDTSLQVGDRVLFQEENDTRTFVGTVQGVDLVSFGDVTEYEVRPDDQSSRHVEESAGSWCDEDGVYSFTLSSWDGSQDTICKLTAMSDETAARILNAPAAGSWTAADLADPQLGWIREIEADQAKPAQNPNPKKAFGATKPDLSLVPPAGTLHQAMALELGASKYGPYNWRKDPVEALTYVSAAMRHLQAYLDGEDYTSDSNGLVHNLGAVMAGCSIVLDSLELGILIDNRPLPGKASAVQERLQALKKAANAAKTR